MAASVAAAVPVGAVVGVSGGGVTTAWEETHMFPS